MSTAYIRWPDVNNGNGDVTGPGSSTSNAVARFSGTTGKIIKNSGVIIDDSNNMSGIGTLGSGAITSSGSVTGTAFIPTGSSVPANGVYLPAANTVGIAANSLAIVRFSNSSGPNVRNETTSAQGSFYYQAVNDGLASYSGGNGNTVGSNVIFYGGTHASKANDIELRSATSIKLGWDDSVNIWTATGRICQDTNLALALAELGGQSNQTFLSGVVQEGVRGTIVGNSSATSRVIAGAFDPRTQATSFTTGILAGIRIYTPTIGAGSTVTRNIGLLFQGVGTSGTNNAFITDNEAFSGNFFINSTSANPSLLSGNLGIGTNTGTEIALRVVGPSAATTTVQYSGYFNPQFNSNATADGAALYAATRTAASSFTMARAYGLYVDTPTVGAGSTITRAMGIYLASQTGATNNAFITDNVSFSGNYFIHSTSTNESSIAGLVRHAGGLTTKYATTNTANPPTNAELITAFGAVATVGSGFIGILNDNGGNANEYIVWCDGTTYWHVAGTKAV